jgi:hypothetical protein
MVGNVGDEAENRVVSTVDYFVLTVGSDCNSSHQCRSQAGSGATKTHKDN